MPCPNISLIICLVEISAFGILTYILICLLVKYSFELISFSVTILPINC